MMTEDTTIKKRMMDDGLGGRMTTMTRTKRRTRTMAMTTNEDDGR